MFAALVAGSTLAVHSTALAQTSQGPSAQTSQGPVVPNYQGPPTTPERVNSINVSPLGLLAGSYSVVYERLKSGTHGLIAEGNFYRQGDETSSAAHAGVGLGYRWHWRGRQNSGFLGVMAAYSVGTGTATITEQDMEYTFDVSIQSLSFTANVGRRWAWRNGFNVTLRVGAGGASRSVTTDSTDPLAQDAVDTVQAILSFLPIAFDGELSIGYNF